MGFLQLDANIGDLSKAIVSLWFRIPSVVADGLRGKSTDGGTISPYHFAGNFITGNCIPLLTFGPQRSSPWYNLNTASTGLDLENGCTISENYYFYDGSPSDHYPSPQTCIGVYVNDPATQPGCIDGQVFLNIQPDNLISSSNVDGFTGFFSPHCVGGRWQYSEVDQSFVLEGYDNYGRMVPSTLGPPATAYDHWHHLLISWDVSGGCASRGGSSPSDTGPFVTRVNKLWFAQDDVNYSYTQLPATTPGEKDVVPWGPNDIISSMLGAYTGSGSSSPEASFSFNVTSVASRPCGIPGPLTLQQSDGTDVTPVERVEMAELQIFAGVTLDTSIIANRRAFIDENGKPVPPSKVFGLLGIKPDVLLHGSGNFKRGINTGTFDGNFAPAGTIKKYTPNPSLHGPQSP